MGKKKKRKITDERLGERLGKYLKDHKIGQEQLIDLASREDDYDEKLQQSNLSEIIRGKGRYLSEDAADIFSRVLGIHPGYLKGEDGYKALNYEDYLIGYIHQDQLQHDFHRYDGILSLAGAKIVNISYDDDYNLRVYHLFMDGRRADFTPEDMDRHMQRLYEDLCEFARKRLGPIMDLGTPSPSPISVSVEHGTITEEDKNEGR